jgi:hypothetical protein
MQKWEKTTPNKTPKVLLKAPKKKGISSEESKKITRISELRDEIQKESLPANNHFWISYVSDLLNTWLSDHLDVELSSGFAKFNNPGLKWLAELSPVQEKILVEQVKNHRNHKKSDFVIDLQKNEPGYEKPNTHDIVFWEWNFKKNELEELLKSGNFNGDTKVFLAEKLNLLKSENDEKKKNNIIKSIDKKIRLEGRKIRTPWIDLKVSVSVLQGEILQLLETIFQKDYFTDIITKQFDIYDFLLSKKWLRDYICKKYNLEKLQWSEKTSKYYNGIIEFIEDMQWVLDSTLDGSHSSLQTEKELSDILYWVKQTVEEISRKIKNI